VTDHKGASPGRIAWNLFFLPSLPSERRENNVLCLFRLLYTHEGRFLPCSASTLGSLGSRKRVSENASRRFASCDLESVRSILSHDFTSVRFTFLFYYYPPFEISLECHPIGSRNPEKRYSIMI